MSEANFADGPFFDVEPEIDLRHALRLVWGRKWLILAATLLAGAAAFAASRLMSPVYEASTKLLINQAPTQQTSEYTAILTSERLARTYSEMIVTRPVLQEVVSRLGISVDLEELQEAIEVSAVRDTQLIEITVEDMNPQRAADVANTLATVFIEQTDALQASRFAASKASLQDQLETLQAQIRQVEGQLDALGEPRSAEAKAEYDRLQSELTQYQTAYTGLLQSYEALRLAEAQSVSNVIQVEPALPPESPVRPRVLLNTFLGLVMGGFIGVAAVFLQEYLDDRLRTADQVERELGLPILGGIASLGEEGAEGVYVAAHPRSPHAEAFRSLRTNVQFASVDRPLRTLMVTSPGPNEGKSMISLNLAAILAQGEQKVILLDADMRRPKLHRAIGVANNLGLADLFIRGSSGLDGALQPTSVPRLQVVTAGRTPPNPAELLASERMGELLQLLREQADIVVIDAPPVTAVTDPVILSAQVDGVLLVVDVTRTERGAAQLTVEALRRSGANLLGVVLNNLRPDQDLYGATYLYRYAYAYTDGEEQTGKAQPRRFRWPVFGHRPSRQRRPAAEQPPQRTQG